MKRSALGRGLSALITDADKLNINRVSSPEEATPASISEVELSLIDANPFQPRSSFDQELLEELALSIKTYGVIQPITVRVTDSNRYQIISGERRFRAAEIAGLTHVPAYIRRADDREMLEMAIVENVQRKDLDAIEIGLGYQRLIDECGLTQEEMAGRVGKGRATITNYIRLLRLPAEIQLALRAEKISMGHARALLSLPSNEEQLTLCNSIIEEELSVRAVEERVRELNEQKELPKVEPKSESEEVVEGEMDEVYFKLLDFLGRYFNDKISLKYDPKREGGSVTIKFVNREEVEKLIEAIEKSNL